jgi:hypothetical protein
VLLVCAVYSEIALSQKLFGIGHMYTYNFLVRMYNTMTSQNIDFSFWDTLNIGGIWLFITLTLVMETEKISDMSGFTSVLAHLRVA